MGSPMVRTQSPVTEINPPDQSKAKLRWRKVANIKDPPLR